MKTLKYTLAALLFLALGIMLYHPAKGQQDAMFSQYMFNAMAINPAYAGSKDYLSASLLHRTQWLGIDGAPVTNTISVHSPLIYEGSSVGATFVHDRIGFTTQTDAYGNYAYRIKMGRNGARLAFGLRAGASFYKVDFNMANEFTQQDHIANGVQGGMAPNAGAGVYFDTRNFYLGLSVPRLISYDSTGSWAVENPALPIARRHYFGAIGYAIEVGENLVIKPSILAKYRKAAPFQADFNLNALLARRVWIGVSYRTNDAILAMVEVLPTKNLQIGYSYDRTISELAGRSNGTHEIILTLNIGKQIALKTPRYF